MSYRNGSGQVLGYGTTASDPVGMGLSLRPPKWLRKAQPGKILKKIALPAAAIAGLFLIPGVGGAVAGALTAGGKAVAGAAGAIYGAAKTVAVTAATTLATQAATQASRTATSELQRLAAPLTAGSLPLRSAAAEGGAAPNASQSAQPFPVVPVAIGAGLLLIAMSAASERRR